MGVPTAIGFLYGAGAVLLMGFAPVKSGSPWPDWFRWIIGSLGVLLIFSSGMAFIGNISSDFAPKPFGIYWTTSVPSVALFTLLAGAILYRVWSEGRDAWVLTLWITVALVLMMALLLGIAMLSVRSTRGLITSTRYVENSGTLISSLSKLLADLNQEQIDFQIAILTGENSPSIPAPTFNGSKRSGNMSCNGQASGRGRWPRMSIQGSMRQRG